MKRTPKAPKIVAEICLYGGSNNAGWLANLGAGNMLGHGEPAWGRSLTEAVWLACDAIRSAGIAKGGVKVFAAGGEWVAVADLNHPGYYGDLKWEAAPAYTISAETVVTAAE